MMTKNLKVKKFTLEAEKEFNDAIASITRQFDDGVKKINEIEFIVFDNDNPYYGDVKNKIFFTYSNHYWANSPLDMTVSCLHHPHLSYEDRGYIKGVAVDLDGYIKLRLAGQIISNYSNIMRVSFPRFKKSKHSYDYASECESIIDAFSLKINEFRKKTIGDLNLIIKEKTNCSLLHYLRAI
jgi:hypothetical protein